MRDVVVIVMTFGFFALCVAYVALCDRIVGPDEQDLDTAPANGAAATDVSAPDGPDPDPALVATGGTSIGRSDAQELTR